MVKLDDLETAIIDVQGNTVNTGNYGHFKAICLKDRYVCLLLPLFILLLLLLFFTFN